MLDAPSNIAKRIAAQLLPGWTVRVRELSREQIDRLVRGALAVCKPLPERSLCTVCVVTPWPEGEDLRETLWHELTHAALSPITAQLGEHPGAVMLEEQIVERIGSLLARAPMAARKAMAAAIGKAPSMLRARISARAGRSLRARSGGTMDPKMITEALEALIAGDAEKCAEILKGLIAQAAGGEAPSAEPDGDEGQMLGDGRKMARKAPAAPRKETRVDEHNLRARKAADMTTGIMIRARLRELRHEGVALDTAFEAELSSGRPCDHSPLSIA